MIDFEALQLLPCILQVEIKAKKVLFGPQEKPVM